MPFEPKCMQYSLLAFMTYGIAYRQPCVGFVVK